MNRSSLLLKKGGSGLLLQLVPHQGGHTPFQQVWGSPVQALAGQGHVPCCGEDVPATGQSGATVLAVSVASAQVQLCRAGAEGCWGPPPGLGRWAFAHRSCVPGQSVLPSCRAVGGRQWLHSIRDDKKGQLDLLQESAGAKV